MPCSASAAASAASGRLCCSSGAQASSTGRPLRGSGAVLTARSALPAVSASRCSTSTPSPVAAHRSPTATSTGQSSSVQVGITPCSATARSTATRIEPASSAIAARASPRVSAVPPGSASTRPPGPPGRTPSSGPSRPDGPGGGPSSVPGRRDLVDREPGRVGRRHPVQHEPAHGLQPGDVGARVAPVCAGGMQGRAEPVAPVPGPQRRGRDAESPGHRGDGEPGLRRLRSQVRTGFRWHRLIIGGTRRRSAT